MAQRNASNLDARLAAAPVIAILRGVTPAEAAAVGEALVAEGIAVIEVPLNSPDPFESIAILSRVLKGRAVVGAGTVLDPRAAENAAEAGAEICVAPNSNPAVIGRALELGLEPFPGVMTPTECFAAINVGARRLKLFPADVCGPGAIKALTAVLPGDVSLFAVGGVGPENISEWLDAGASGVGVGGSIYKSGDSAAAVARKASAVATALRRAK